MPMMQNGLYEIYSTWHVPFWQTTPFYIMVGVALLVVVFGLALLALRWIKARRARKTSWEQALLELEQLSKSSMGVGSSKEFYVQLILIVKRYLYGRYGYNVSSKTDQELIAHLALTDISPDLLTKLCAIIDGSMMIKFANMQVIQEQMKRDLDVSISLIISTIPRTQHR